MPPSPPQPPPAEPRHTVEIVPGMAMQQVKAAMGSPDRVVKLGSKEIQFFGKLKVTFVNGKVADVE